jgi:hypothetical protein
MSYTSKTVGLAVLALAGYGVYAFTRTELYQALADEFRRGFADGIHEGDVITPEVTPGTREAPARRTYARPSADTTAVPFTTRNIALVRLFEEIWNSEVPTDEMSTIRFPLYLEQWLLTDGVLSSGDLSELIRRMSAMNHDWAVRLNLSRTGGANVVQVIMIKNMVLYRMNEASEIYVASTGDSATGFTIRQPIDALTAILLKYPA